MMSCVMTGAVAMALVVDYWLGEPRARWHPVVWMGRYLAWAGRWVAPASSPSLQFTPDLKRFGLGMLFWWTGATVVSAAAWVLQDAIMTLPKQLSSSLHLHAVVGTALATALLGLVLKPLLAWAMLKSEVMAVEAALGESVQAGRERLSWLVSRDVAALTEAQVRESAIESLAENLNDSVVAPIFWFLLLGLPGAALYRFANTADAMWGYRGVRNGQVWEWGGKWAAWADDVLSWMPARITAALLMAVSGTSALCTLRQEARRTPSPNSGWPMAAMALGLGVCLHKPGVYALNAPGRSPQSADTHQAIVYSSKLVRVLVVVGLIFVGTMLLVGLR